MSDTKYLILELHKYSYGIKDVWSVKFSDLTRDKAFTKLVALETLNDNKDITFHLLNTKDLWTKEPEEKPLVLKDEVKQNSESEDMPF
tara:strand:+ start:88 stop:351 length:264 start_codon:yes stop_codon:yes gene_type:complete